jgi:hypothetical protein
MSPSTPKLSEVARHLVIPDGIVSTGWPAVRDTCANLGIAFDLWQDGAGRIMLGKGADGLYAADAVVLSIPRQVGKTYLIGWIIFALCLIRPGLTVIWTAHRYKTASETYESMRAMARRPRMRAHISKVPQGAGNQAVMFRNGSRILFGARERGFGRGFAGVDVLVFDEAQILTDHAIDDMVPATNHSANPLVFFMGTPPKPGDASEVFTRHRAEALSGQADDEVYIEISADRGADPGDEGQWAKANPSYPTRTTARAILRMRKNLTADAFLREGLGIWDDMIGGRPITPAALAAVIDPGSRLVGRPLFAVDLELDRSATAIAAGGFREDGLPHAKVIDYRPGTGWALERARELNERHDPLGWAVNDSGPAGALIPDLEAPYERDGKSFPGLNVIKVNSSGMGNACGRLQDLTTNRGWRYPGPGPDKLYLLAAALASATTRALGDRWAWDRRGDAGIAPLVAVTEVLWALTTIPRPATPWFGTS